MSGKYYFIGDIHGCADELKALLKKIKVGKNDHIVSVGDIINKGPKSDEAVRILMQHNAQAVMGNHDILIKYVHEEINGIKKSPFPLKEKHFLLYNSLSKQSLEYILNLKFYLDLPEIQTRVVHAGILPFKSIGEMTEEELTCVRIVDPLSKAYIKRDKTGYPWYFYYNGLETIIYGHNAAESIKINKNTIGIDTGCLYGNKLTAYVMPDRKFIQVKAKKVYEDYSQNGLYRMPR